MNRRTFLGSLAALVPIGALAWWWRRDEGASKAPPPAARPKPGPKASASRAAGATSAEDLVYVGGLPVRRADPEGVAEPCRAALRVARKLVLRHCTDLDFPNGAIHGVRALGRKVNLGSDAYRTILERFTRERYVGGQVVLEVAVLDEGHRHAMLKTLIERGCDLDLEFDHEDRRYRFRDYVNSARLLYAASPSERIDEESWTLMALARVTPPSSTGWTNLYGHTVDLSSLIDRTSSLVLQDTQLVRQIDVDLADVPRNCSAFGRVCGGLHMLYAFAVALSCGHTNERRRSEFERHMQTLVRRFRYDLKVVDQVEALNANLVGAERAAITAFDARLKFLGHAFEIVGLAQQFDLYTLTDAELEHVEAGRETLCSILRSSESVDWQAIQADRPLYESVTGGLCHAYNGLLTSAT